MAHMLNNLGCLAAEHGDDDEARVRLEESLATLRAIGDAVTSRGPLIHLGLVHYRRGEYATARALLTESLRICRRLGDLRLIVECLHGLVEVAIAEARPGALGCRAAGIATRLLAASVALREAIDFAFKEWEPLADTLRETLGDDAFTAAWEAGRSLTWQQAADLSVAGHAHE
jgi:hypothetical protein